MKSFSPLYANMAWRLALDIVSRGSFFLINILIARRLGVTEFGKFAYTLSFVQMFYSITELGMHLQATKELGERVDSAQSIWMPFFELKMILMAISFVLLAPLSVFLWKWESPWIPVAALFWMFSNSMLDFNQYTCNGLGRLDLAQRMMIFQRGLTLLGAIVPLFFMINLEGAVLGIALGSVLGAFLANVYFFRESGITFSWKNDWPRWKTILAVSLPTGFASVFGQCWVRMGAFLLGLQWSSQIVGEYGAAFRIFETTYIVPAAVMAISAPHLSGALRRGYGDFYNELKRVLKVMVPTMLIWGFGLYLFSPLLVNLLFGSGFSGAIPVLRILGMVAAFVFLNYMVSHLIVIVGCQRRNAINVFITFMLSLCLFTYFIEDRNSIGAAQAFLLTEAAFFLLTLLSLWQWRGRQQARCASPSI